MATKLGVSHVAAADISIGDVIVQGELVGIAAGDIASGETGRLSLMGVFNIPKAIGGSTAITAGALVYWDATNKVGTTTVGSNKLMGKSVRACGDNDRYVRVILTP